MSNKIENTNLNENIQALYESIIYSSEDAIISKTIDGIITTWNPSAEILFGYSSKEAIGKHISIIIPTDRLLEEIEIISKLKNGEYVKNYETIRCKKNGDLLNISLTVSPIKNATGQIIGASKIVRNISERIEKDNKLKLSLKEIADYKYALDESSIVAITNQKGVIKYVNDNFCKISKYSSDELIGQDHRIINSGHHSKEFIRNIWITVANGKIWRGELKNKAKDGSYYWVDTTIVPFLDEYEKPYQYIAIRNDISSRKKAEEELLSLNITLDKKVQQRTNALTSTQNDLKISLERANFLATIANSIQDPVISMDADRNINKWNEAAEKLFGWSSSEVIGKTVKDVLSIEYITISREEIYRLLQTQGSCKGEAVAYTKSGKKLFLLATASVLKDVSGNTVGALAVCRDITERKVAEEALYKLNNDLEMLVVERTKEVYASEEKYRNLFDNNPLPMLALDLETLMFVDVNRMTLKHYGYSRNEFLSMKATDLRPQEDADKFTQIDFNYNPMLLNHNKGIWKHIKKDGSIILVEITTNDVIYEGRKTRLILANDVTEKKRVEEKLIASEKQFRHTLDNMLEGAQIIDFNWRYVYVNDSMAKHGKYSKEELIGYTVMEKYPGIEDSEIFKVYQQCFNERIAIHLENEFTFPDKTTGWFELSFQPVPEGIFILSVDITSRKKAEQEILFLNETLEKKVVERTSQLMSVNNELDAFTYSVSHDLRAPLRAINGYSTILLEDFTTKLGDEATRITNNIVFNVTKMSTLIDDLLSFSRLGRKELALIKISMQSKVDEVCKEIAAQSSTRKIEFKINNLKPAFVDASLFKQVWLNLISNAVKYSQTKPVSIIEIGNIDSDDDTLTYYVKDNGVGFDMRYYDKLFGVFQRLHSEKTFEGTGVGLAIVHRIITKHNGKIWAESKLNEGTIFYFTLKKMHNDIQSN